MTYNTPMRCNLDAKGKLLRLLCGVTLACAGAVIVALALLAVLTGWWAWVTGLALLAVGAFQVYEGWCGWCVLRAMGFRTPI